MFSAEISNEFYSVVKIELTHITDKLPLEIPDLEACSSVISDNRPDKSTKSDVIDSDSVVDRNFAFDTLLTAWQVISEDGPL